VKAVRKAPSIRGYACSAHEKKYPHEPLIAEVGPRTDIADRAALEQASINAGLRPLDGNSADHLRIEGRRPNAADAARDNRIDLVFPRSLAPDFRIGSILLQKSVETGLET